MNHPKSFGVWGNTDKESFWEILPDILAWSGKKGLDAYLTTRILNHENGSTLSSKKIRSKDDMSVLDFMLVLGGDGTFLSLARAIEHRNTPILGIHLGDLGFLAKVTLKDLFVRLDQVANGDFIVEKRILVKASIKKNGQTIHHVGLNDFVLSNGQSHRMLNATVSVNGHLVGNYRSDGLIIATPTGSTAYSLSAGGPIVTPEVDSLIITPTAAHTLTSRPLVIPADSKIILNFPDTNDSILFIADGQVHESLDPSCQVEITKSHYDVKLIDFKDSDYFQTLRTKMGWGKRGEH
ncbi:MAG: NAD(+)/NADH kinase [Candidatus Neomarinimicrobiota bacterium]|nr:NAD(+)/NADH kinase [Candidatus Neomarinimicrobiota bacterium]